MTIASLVRHFSKFRGGPIYSGICSKCTKIFYCRWNRKRPPQYCSNNCRNISRQRRVNVTCQLCCKSFIRTNCIFAQSRRHFCSYRCWYKYSQGKNCHLWKRGWWLNGQGYKMIMTGRRKVAEHIYIMEKIIGRKMKGRGKEVVHHIDHNKLNNDPKNLRLMTMSDHVKLHADQRSGRLPFDDHSRLSNHQHEHPHK